MIQSFGNKWAEHLFNGASSKETRQFPQDLKPAAFRKLDLLNRAELLESLGEPPGNRLEALSGNLKGLHSIRINDQWCIVFRWTPEGSEKVQIIDYHQEVSQ